MNICFFALEHHSLGSGGGIASYLEAIVPELARLGHEIHIIAKGKSHKSILLEKGICLHEFRGGNVHWYLSKVPVIGRQLALPLREIEWSVGFYRRFKGLKEKYSFDLIESSETGNLLTALFEKSVPVVTRLHGSTYSFEKATQGTPSLGAWLDRILQRLSFRRAKAFSAPSEFQKKMFERELGNRFTADVIPNPVLNHYSPQAHQAKIDSSISSKLIFYAGRIAAVKGVWPLLKSFVEVAGKCPDARLLIAGAPHASISGKALDSFMEGRHISDKVKFLGHIQKEMISEYYEMCSVYVVPSYYESFCLSAVEAMLHGKPVVGFSGTALDEIVEDGRTGILVLPGDEKALAGALLKLINDDTLVTSMGEAGREKAIKMYRSDLIANQIVNLYNGMVQRNGKTLLSSR